MNIEKVVYQDYKFYCHMDDGKVLDAGPNLIGMLHYVYGDIFLNGWEVVHIEFMKEYNGKIFAELTQRRKEIDKVFYDRRN